MALPLVAYLGVAVIGLFASACRPKPEGKDDFPAKNSKPLVEDPQLDPWIAEGSPAYRVYQELETAGVRKVAMDCFEPGDELCQKDGVISEAELRNTARSLFRQYPENPAFRRIVESTFQDIAQNYLEAGMPSSKQSRKPCENLSNYQEAFLYDPMNASVNYMLGVCSKRDNDYFLLRSMHLAANFPEPYYQMGAYYLSKGENRKAEAYLRVGLKIAPGKAEFYYLLGLALGRQGEKGQAVQALRKALRINPDYAEAHLALGKILKKLGNHAEAKFHLKKGNDLSVPYL